MGRYQFAHKTIGTIVNCEEGVFRTPPQLQICVADLGDILGEMGRRLYDEK